PGRASRRMEGPNGRRWREKTGRGRRDSKCFPALSGPARQPAHEPWAFLPRPVGNEPRPADYLGRPPGPAAALPTWNRSSVCMKSTRATTADHSDVSDVK